MWVVCLISLIALLGVGYALIILLYRNWFLRLQQFYPNASTPTPQTSFTIIIPARNEATNIGNCINGILAQQYPAHLYEIIVVDDFSTDETATIVANYQATNANVLILPMATLLQGQQLNSYKKKAIELAIKQASNEWIVTTDADCIVPPTWLATYDAFIQKNNVVFVGAPVMFTNNGSILQCFQAIDFMTMQGVTAAAVSAGFHSMCNGANLAYQKAAFHAVNGFAGIDNIASGDDMLLMNKIKVAYPKGIGFLFSKAAIVLTEPMLSWKGFFNQRIRWASKADKYNDKSIFWVLLLMYLWNVGLFVMPWLGLLDVRFGYAFLLLVCAKTGVEICFAKPVAAFFGIKLRFKYIFLQYHHITYMVIAGWLGKFGKYQWKGRNVR